MRPRSSADVRIVGIDPGTIHTGYAVVTTHGQMERLGSIDPHESLTLSARLWKIEQEVHRILKDESVLGRVHVALEDAIVYRAKWTTIALACVRGVILAQAARLRCKIWSYNIMTVKKAIAGRGNAEKSEVADRVKLMCGIGNKEIPFDATDALAVAMYHRYQKFP